MPGRCWSVARTSTPPYDNAMDGRHEWHQRPERTNRTEEPQRAVAIQGITPTRPCRECTGREACRMQSRLEHQSKPGSDRASSIVHFLEGAFQAQVPKGAPMSHKESVFRLGIKVSKVDGPRLPSTGIGKQSHSTDIFYK